MTRCTNIFYSEMETPIGPLTIVSTDKGICRLDFESGDIAQRNIELWARRYFQHEQLQRDDIGLHEIKQQLDQYFRGLRETFECELDIQGTSFQKLVWKALLDIPYGEVRSYKEVAQAIGAPKAVRAIGGANNKNKIPIIIPCHRVIGSNGALVGYGGGLPIKEKLLSLEGYDFINQKKA